MSIKGNVLDAIKKQSYRTYFPSYDDKWGRQKICMALIKIHNVT